MLYGEISAWNTALVTDMSRLFNPTGDGTPGLLFPRLSADLSGWRDISCDRHEWYVCVSDFGWNFQFELLGYIARH